MRGIARHLKISRTTVERKFLWLSEHKRVHAPPYSLELQFDELETIEHTKCKPISVLVCVTEGGEPVSFKVASMPAKGKLASFSRKHYGPRSDDRSEVLRRFLEETPAPSFIKTDGKGEYRSTIQRFWPKAKHQVHSRKEKERQQSRLHELSYKKEFDPMFSLNHMCARLRADIRRLTRRSWCTTKKLENLQKHLDLYLYYRLVQ